MELTNKTFEQKNIWKDVLGIFVVSRLLIACAGILANMSIRKGYFMNRFQPNDSFLHLFYKWDCGWYISIVRKGYYFILGKESNVSFYPLYPIHIKIFSSIFRNPILTGNIISNVALLGAAIYLYKLISLDFEDTKISSRTVLYFLICPLSFFFSICYTEGLFLFLAITCFYYARKKRWLTVSILGYFLALTRKPGILILIPALLEYLDIDFKSFKIDTSKIKKDILYLLLIPAGMFTYMSYLNIKFGDPIAMFHSQNAWGRRPSSIIATFKSLQNYSTFYDIFFVGSVVFGLIMVLYLILPRVRMSYIVYSLVLIYCNLSTGLLESVPRFMSVVFPIYLGMSLIANKNKFLDCFFILFSVMLLTLFTILFVNGYWMT